MIKLVIFTLSPSSDVMRLGKNQKIMSDDDDTMVFLLPLPLDLPFTVKRNALKIKF